MCAFYRSGPAMATALSILSAAFGAQAQDPPRAYHEAYDGLDFSASTGLIRPEAGINWVTFDCNDRLRRIPAFAPFTPRQTAISGVFSSIAPKTVISWIHNHALPRPYGTLDTSRARIKIVFDSAGTPYQIQTPQGAQRALEAVNAGRMDGTGIAPADHERIRDYARRVCGV